MEGEEQGRKRPVGSERSLGWLTQSAVQPKKRKEIEGAPAPPPRAARGWEVATF